MSDERYSAIILAAGYSSRMGRFKPLLPMGGKTVIERVVDVFKENNIRNICVVAGHRASDLRRAVQSSGVRIVENPGYDRGMFSSVKAGVKHLDIEKTEAFFVAPADICLVRPLTVRLLVTAYENKPGKIVHPRFDSKRGHPPLIPASLASVILTGEADGSLKTILEKFEHLAIGVQVPDRHILFDMNRPEDYEEALLRYQNHDIPTAAECDVILNHVFPVTEDIASHCREVEHTALLICRALQKAGMSLNVELVGAAALLHDIAKGRKNHAETGARMLLDMGFPRVAKIVSRHIDLNFDFDAKINEADIVYMADKLIKENHRTTLEKRFENALKRFGHDPEARAAVLRRQKTTMALKEKLERRMGASVESIIAKSEK
jgi:molybdenum cofactor cytidylyltransferase